MTARTGEAAIERATNRPGRRVLMMCYFFPPIHSVGAHRSVGFAQHLPDLGWTPTVLSVTKTRIPWERSTAPVPPDLEIVRAAELNLHRVVEVADAAANRVFRLVGARKAPAMLQSGFWMPDPQIAWLSVPAAIRLARRVDCIYVSCSPFSAAVTGAPLRERSARHRPVGARSDRRTAAQGMTA